MNLSRMTISVKLLSLSGFFLSAIVIIGAFDWVNSHNSDQATNEALMQAHQLESAVDTARKAQVDFKIQVQEWKDTLLRGNDPANFDKYSKAFLQKSADTQAGLSKLKGILETLQLDTKMVDGAREAHKELGEKYTSALQKYDTANPDSAHVVDALVKGMDRPPTKQIDDIVAYVLSESDHLMAETKARQEQSYRHAVMLSVGVICLVFVIGLVFTLYLVRHITRPLQRAVEIAKAVAAGQLGQRIEVSGHDETAQLLQALKEMSSSLNQIVSEVRQSTDTIATASTEIAAGNLDLSSRTEQQAGSLEETAATMEELNSTVKHNADNTKEASRMASAASEIARKGGVVVGEVIQTMGSINDSSKKIVDIIAVIDGIAFQTNILALNAAVEAARAGEQGRGFAVVASEVRNLAQRSASAAKEIKVLINDSVQKVGSGTALVDQAGITMKEVVGSVEHLNMLINEISEANQEQTNGIHQINEAIIQMDTVTQQNAALVEEAAAAAESMQNQAAHLEQVVSRFRLESIVKTASFNTDQALHSGAHLLSISQSRH